jgi:hypothetical protein
MGAGVDIHEVHHCDPAPGAAVGTADPLGTGCSVRSRRKRTRRSSQGRSRWNAKRETAVRGGRSVPSCRGSPSVAISPIWRWRSSHTALRDPSGTSLRGARSVNRWLPSLTKSMAITTAKRSPSSTPLSFTRARRVSSSQTSGRGCGSARPKPLSPSQLAIRERCRSLPATTNSEPVLSSPSAGASSRAPEPLAAPFPRHVGCVESSGGRRCGERFTRQLRTQSWHSGGERRAEWRRRSSA